MAESITCTLITPEQEVFEKEATYIDLPAHDGQMGFMAKRAPLLVKLGTGVMTVKGSDGETRVRVSGGFAQMKRNTLAVLTDKAEDV